MEANGSGRTYLQVFSVTPGFARHLLRFCHSAATGIHRQSPNAVGDRDGNSMDANSAIELGVRVVADSSF
jgi:hypothetical protein